jgi:predicted glycosyltransferase involved in capsule biosynthesis
MDTNRLEQFKVTKRAYDKMKQKKEFIIPTRSKELAKLLMDNQLMKDVLVILYEHEVGFNPAKALNLGVKNAKYDHIIITSPEVKPKTAVLNQLETLLGENVVCQVWDEDENHKVTMSLVHKGFRDENPGMYFLAMFNKADIEAINGWDEEFMRGYGYEDNDFGARWVRAGLPFMINEEIQGVHQYHPRSETIPGGLNVALNLYNANNSNGIIKPLNGLNKL